MGRPIAPIIHRGYQPPSQSELIVTEGPGHWVVVYQGRPIGVLSHNNSPEILTRGMKYGKTGFTFPGHAHALARRLNKRFMTTDYTVIKVL